MRCFAPMTALASQGSSESGMFPKLGLTYFRAWLRAVRPPSLTASVIPVLVGVLLAARRHFDPVALVVTLTASVAIQIGVNLANDYFDDRQGLDAARALRPDMTIQTGDLSVRSVLAGAVTAFLVALALGLWLIWRAGVAIFWLGLASVFAGYAYTAAPFKLGYRALGEVVVFVFMGPVIVEGAYYVQLHRWSLGAGLASLPVALLVTAILHANNLRDAEDDRRNGKRTLANLFGPHGAVIELRLLVLATYLSLLGLVAGIIIGPGALLALLTLPSALQIWNWAGHACELEAQNRLLRATARLHFRFGLLLCAGLLLSLALH